MITEKCLWLSQRSRVDLQLSTGYHCARAKNLNVHDKNNLKHEIGYLCKTRFLILIVSIDDYEDDHVYVDGAQLVHSDGKGHSGLHFTIGTASMMSVSKKLGLVTMSSTEMETVSMGERFPTCAWFGCFCIAQGEESREDTLMHDNKIPTLMHKNYPCSIGK